MKHILILLLFSAFIALAQDQKKPKEEKPSENTRKESDVKKLDEIFIERNDVLNVKGGEKRKPRTLPTLSKSDLDSLNSLEKQQSLLLPSVGLPRQIVPKSSDRAYLQGEFGRFSTIDAEAGYSFSFDDFDIYSMANLELSGGHLDNAGYLDGSLRLISDYVADPKFWVFGGSKTRTRFDYNHAEFSNFSIDNPEDRSMDSVSLMMDVDGNYNGFLFYTGAGFDLLSLRADTLSLADRGINGYLKVINPYKNWRFQAGAIAEFRSGNQQSNNFLEATGRIGYLSKFFDFHIEGGGQIAQNDVESIFVPRFSAGVTFQSDQDFTITARASSGVQRNTFANFFRFNPYLAWDTYLDHTIEQLSIDGDVKYHPTSRFNIRLGTKISLLGNTANWLNSDSSQFIVNYQDARQFKIFAEAYYDLSENTSISVLIENNNIITDSLDNQQTYVPQFLTAFDLNSNLFENFSANLGLDFVGKRFADLNNDIEIDPYLDLRAKFTFMASENFNVYIKGENLLNQNIFLFNLYRQRGLFISAGILWKF